MAGKTPIPAPLSDLDPDTAERPALLDAGPRLLTPEEWADAATEELPAEPQPPRPATLAVAVSVAALSLTVLAAILAAVLLYLVTRPPPTPDIPHGLSTVLPDDASASAPTPPPPPPDDRTADELVAAGWDTVGKDAEGGLALFELALAASPAHAEARYGVGYAELQLGHVDRARDPLCAASHDLKDPDSLRDVRMLLARHGLSCPPRAD